jgi:hypothetical protein
MVKLKLFTQFQLYKIKRYQADSIKTMNHKYFDFNKNSYLFLFSNVFIFNAFIVFGQGIIQLKLEGSEKIIWENPLVLTSVLPMKNESYQLRPSIIFQIKENGKIVRKAYSKELKIFLLDVANKQHTSYSKDGLTRLELVYQGKVGNNLISFFITRRFINGSWVDITENYSEIIDE